ncbi:DUF2767 family protein [Shigella flexneri]
MENRTKDDELYREMSRLSVKLCGNAQYGQDQSICFAGISTALANKRIQRSELEKQAMETVINALVK